jgi:hypothetical protein
MQEKIKGTNMNDQIIDKAFSHIVTPPDYIESTDFTVVLIDPEWSQVEDLSLLLKTADKSFTVYVYRNEMDNREWLMKAIANSSASIINTVSNELSPIKDKLAINSDAYYYGEKNFLMNKNRIEAPVDYFVDYLAKHK